MHMYIDMLNHYRETVIDLYELEAQLSAIGTDGRPVGYRGFRFDMNSGRTNDPAAAARQLSEGIEAMIQKKREELGKMACTLKPLLLEITNVRTLMIIQRYYCFADTDESIAMQLRLSPQRVNQVRHQYLRSLQAQCS